MQKIKFTPQETGFVPLDLKIPDTKSTLKALRSAIEEEKLKVTEAKKPKQKKRTVKMFLCQCGKRKESVCWPVSEITDEEE